MLKSRQLSLRFFCHIILILFLFGTTGCVSQRSYFKWTKIDNGRERFGQVSAQNKRSWVKTEGVPRIAAQNQKRLFIKTNVDPQILALAAADKRSVWKETNALLEAMAMGTIAVLEPEAPTLDPEYQASLEQEHQALELAGIWDDYETAVSGQSVVDAVIEPGSGDDFPLIINQQVEVYLELFQGTLRDYFATWLARSGRYLPMMEAEFEDIGLPRDLVYLAMIESGFNQRAYSKAKAMGLWQFMAATGREYGLEVSEYLDERRGLIKPTRAAARYLADLYDEFGDWYLAVAAYNGGPGTLRKAIKKSETEDFWQLAQQGHLPRETRGHVPKLIAAAIISNDPEAYGFADIVYEEPITYDTIPVGPGLSFEAAAVLTKSSGAVIKSLNEELVAHKTPLHLETYTLRIPPGTREVAESNLLQLNSTVSDADPSGGFSKEVALAEIQ